MKFRRATHTVDGRYRDEVFGPDKCTPEMEVAFHAHQYLVNILNSEYGMSMQEIMDKINKDTINFRESPPKWDYFGGKKSFPLYQDVCVSMIRLLETGFVEVIN